MGQVADVIKGLEGKLADEQIKRVAAEEHVAALTAQVTTLQAGALDDADKAAVAEAQGILNPPTPPAAPAQ